MSSIIPPTAPPPAAIRQEARACYAAHLGSDFPEDVWLTIAPEWDLNLFVDEEKVQCRATLYPVVNGQTAIQRGYPVHYLSAPTLKLLFFALRTYRAIDLLNLIEESLPMDEAETLSAFLAWVKADPERRAFGEATFSLRFEAWENTLQEGRSC